MEESKENDTKRTEREERKNKKKRGGMDETKSEATISNKKEGAIPAFQYTQARHCRFRLLHTLRRSSRDRSYAPLERKRERSEKEKSKNISDIRRSESPLNVFSNNEPVVEVGIVSIYGKESIQKQ